MSESPKLSPLAPYLSVRGAAKAIKFYTQAFAAKELQRFDYEGKIGYALLEINGGHLMLSDEFPDIEAMTGNVAPPTLDGRTTTTISLTVDDADAWFDRAVAAGAEGFRAVRDEFFGRHGKLRDPFGHVWSVVTLKPGM